MHHGGAGLTPRALRSLFPQLVVVMITPFGLTGPMARETAGALELQALTGYLYLNGPPGGPPKTTAYARRCIPGRSGT